METVKTTDKHIIVKKRSGRYGVKLKNGGWVRGDDKVQILVAEGLVKLPTPKAKEEPAAGGGE